MRTESEFPRKLNDIEKQLLFLLLPPERNGYNLYREKIANYFVLGYGRYGGGNLILGNEDDEIDFTMPSAPVFAVGNVKTAAGDVYIVIHEEFENQIEVDFSEPEILKSDNTAIISSWSYSAWKPGMKNPANNEKIREIHIIKNALVVAISPSDKKIWVFEKESGVNHFIPVTKFYDELMRIKEEKDPKIALDASRFFTELQTYSDELIARAFLVYNKYWKKMEIDSSRFVAKNKPKRTFLKLFKRGKSV